MIVCIRVKMKSDYIFDMLLYHMYSRFSGFLINLAGLMIIMMAGLWLRFGKFTLMQAAGYLLVGVLVLIYTPLSLKLRAEKIMKQAKYQQEIRYQFDDQGVLEQLDGNSVRYGWSQVQRAVATPKDIVFYMEDDKALVFPKVSLQDDFMRLMKLIVSNMEREQVYIR